MGVINIHLLSSKNIAATFNDLELDAQRNYQIIAGEDNATKFVIDFPEDYATYAFSVGMVNACGVSLPPTVIVNKGFTLPKSMAVPGYTHLYISASFADVTVNWMYVKIKISSYLPDWKNNVSQDTEKALLDAVATAVGHSAEAGEAAAKAVSAAETAKDKAAAAETSATNANTKSNNAATAANNAVSKAEEAVQTADEAAQTAGAANQTAAEAKNIAISKVFEFSYNETTKTLTIR